MESGLPGKVLIVRLGAIGDVVNALVVASAIAERAPGTRVGWAVHDLALPLVEGHPAVQRVHHFRRGGGIRGFASLVAEIRAEGYGLALDLQRIAKSALVARLSGAPRVAGFDRRDVKEASWLLTRERAPPLDPGAHRVEQYLAAARHLGLAVERPRFELPADPRAEARAEALVAELGGAPVLINVGASKPANRWPPGRFGELARLARASLPFPVAFTGGPGDRAAAEAALAAAGEPAPADLVGRTSLLELAALQRRSAAVVSCDTGPMHLAAAAGATVVALFAAADPRRTGPYGPRHRVVRPAAPGRRGRAPMEDIDPASVFEELRAVLL